MREAIWVMSAKGVAHAMIEADYTACGKTLSNTSSEPTNRRIVRCKWCTKLVSPRWR